MATYSKKIKHFADLAQKNALPFVHLDTQTCHPYLLKLEHRYDYLRLQALPIALSTTLTVATTNPSQANKNKIIEFFTKKYEKKIKLVVITPDDFNAVLADKFKEEDTYTIANIRDVVDEYHSASHTFSPIEKLFLSVLVVLIVYGAATHFFLTALWVNLFLSSGTLILMAYKLGLTLYSMRYLFQRPPENPPKPLAVYPIYTVLIPLLFEEKNTLTLLAEALSRLDYPQDKLDVKFLMEAHDLQTLSILKQMDLPWNYQLLIVPAGEPRSKPRACNYGVRFALGEYLTIYDAEDRPDPDQLKIALRVMRNSEPEVGCVQASLNFYNFRENIITRLFTIEYTYWYDCLVPALSSLSVLVPLGGTSNHFKTVVLREIGGWDPYLGTEDAEIGVRLGRHGYIVKHINSTTYEEANTRLWNWFKQRSRWNKGYMQTYLLNMRDPINLLKQLGFWKFINFQFFVGGNVFFQLANLPLWLFFGSSIFFYHSLTDLFPNTLLALCWYNFLISNTVLLICQFAATYHRRLYRLLPFVPLKILYWLLMSFAGYYAVYELLVRPGYWYKTQHNLSKQGRKTDVPLDDKNKK